MSEPKYAVGDAVSVVHIGADSRHKRIVTSVTPYKAGDLVHFMGANHRARRDGHMYVVDRIEVLAMPEHCLIPYREQAGA